MKMKMKIKKNGYIFTLGESESSCLKWTKRKTIKLWGKKRLEIF